jgi:autotransporter-associated beta strand protein
MSGGGIVDFTGAGAYTYAVSSAANGIEVMATGGDTILQLSDSSGVTLTGNTTVDTGCTIQLLATNQMATTGTLTLNGAGGATGTQGALENKSGSNTFGAPIVLASNSTIASDSNNTLLTLTGGINNGGNLLTISGTGNTTVSGTGISGLGGLTEATSGTGTVTLAAVNSYSGATSVNSGRLLVSGSLTGTSATTVASGATLGGGGLINSTLSVTGTVAPGITLSTAGTALAIGNNVTFNAGSQFLVNLNDTSHVADSLTINGSLSLIGSDTLTVNLLGINLTSGTPYTIASFTGGETGTFANVNYINGTNTDGYTLEYNSGNIELVTAIPEPSTWAMLVASTGILVCSQRVRRRLVK